METIQDLVDFLNSKCTLGTFIYGCDNHGITLYKKVDGDLTALITFYEDEDYPAWSIRDFGTIAPRNQKTIIDFACNTDRKKWFKLPEKFNIIMGYDVQHIIFVAYCWDEIGDRETIYPVCEVYKEELDKDEFLFTESDVEYLKSNLSYPQNLMIDLGVIEGKRRVKGDK